jgi:3-oxoacyl-[acyl-carrier-protein] synthase-3
MSKMKKKIKIADDKFPILMGDVGNTVSSTIPLALYKMRGNGALTEKRRLMLIGFGVGYSWSACLLSL